MKRKLIIAILLLSSSFVFSQEQDFSVKKQKKYSSFILRLNFNSDIWLNKPPGLIGKDFNYTTSGYGIYSTPISNSNFNFEMGAGFGNHNLRMSNILKKDIDGKVYFTAIPKRHEGPNGEPGKEFVFKKSNLNLNYFDIPIALRYQSKGDFQISVGMKIGVLINSYYKYKGDDYLENHDEIITFKRMNIKELNNYRIGPTFSVGYKWVAINAYYSLSPIFDELKGPDVFPLSVGVTIHSF